MPRLWVRYAVAVVFVLTVPLPSVVRADPVVPDFDPANFVPGAPIDNPYFPLVPGTVFKYSANVTDDEGESTFQELEDFVTFNTIQVAGVTVRVVRAREFEDGLLAEDTLDYYAQDKSGNVWYLGEDTKEILYDDDDNPIGFDTSGSWRAGVNGAQPGFIMPAEPAVGFEYFQEFAEEDEAVDQAKVVSLNDTITTSLGTFTNVRKILESTALEPGQFEHKLYAPGIGLVLIEEDLQPDGTARNPIPLRSVSAIPLPPAAWTGMVTLSMLLASRGASALRRRLRA